MRTRPVDRLQPLALKPAVGILCFAICAHPLPRPVRGVTTTHARYQVVLGTAGSQCPVCPWVVARRPLVLGTQPGLLTYAPQGVSGITTGRYRAVTNRVHSVPIAAQLLTLGSGARHYIFITALSVKTCPPGSHRQYPQTLLDCQAQTGQR
ncbi:hypothetical protein ORF058R [Spotted knifejaw iridovirus]|nr:hypothetical protein ORF058R [Spotted knifejaw iridovirus]